MTIRYVSWDTIDLVKADSYTPPGTSKNQWINIEALFEKDVYMVSGSKTGSYKIWPGDVLVYENGNIYKPNIVPRLGKYPGPGLALVEAGVPVSVLRVTNLPVIVEALHQEWVLGGSSWFSSKDHYGDVYINGGDVVVVGKVVVDTYNPRRPSKGFVYHRDIVVRKDTSLEQAAKLLRRFLLNI